MRCTQVIGLPGEAVTFLMGHVKRTPAVKCPTCGHVSGGETIEKVYDHAASEGMFGDGPELVEYELTDGRTARERVQAVPWSSGPMIYLCLEISDGTKIQWPEDEIGQH